MQQTRDLYFASHCWGMRFFLFILRILLVIFAVFLVYKTLCLYKIICIVQSPTYFLHCFHSSKFVFFTNFMHYLPSVWLHSHFPAKSRFSGFTLQRLLKPAFFSKAFSLDEIFIPNFQHLAHFCLYFFGDPF